MAKYSVPDGYWDEPDEPAESEPVVEVDYHTIEINDHRDSHGYEYGLRWSFLIEDGHIKYVDLGHYLEGRTQWDPMAAPTWNDVPGLVKQQLARELNVGDLDLQVDQRLFEDGDHDA